jgi:splicing factor 3A subunit 3
MSSNYLEQMRTTFSSIEVIEKTVVYCLFGRKTLPQHAVLLEHRVNNLLQMGQRHAHDALALIEGADGWKKDELDFL